MSTAVDEPAVPESPPPPPPPPPAQAEPTTTGWRWRRGLVVLAGIVVLLGVILSRPAGPTRAADTEHSKRDAINRLLPGDPPLVQKFVATEDRLSSISGTFGTYLGSIDCDVRITVTDDSGATLADVVRSCSTMPDNVRTSLVTFKPALAASKGKTYQLAEAVIRGTSGPAIWSTTGTQLPHASQGGTDLQSSAEISTGYQRGSRVWDLLGLALRRMHDYGPFWQTPWFVVLDVLAVIGLLTALAMAPRRAAGALIVVFAVSRGLLWAAVLPPMAGPDEPNHVAYGQILAERHIPLKLGAVDGLPGLSPEISNATVVLGTASTTLNRPDYDGSGPARLRAVTNRISSQNSPSMGYSPAYYLVPALMEKLPGRIDQRAGYMRLWSIALGAATVWLSYRIGRRLFPRHHDAAVLLAIAVAMQPMLTQQTTVVNNDAGLIAGGALCLLVALQLADRFAVPGWPASRRIAGTLVDASSRGGELDGHRPDGPAAGTSGPPASTRPWWRSAPSLPFWAGAAAGLAWLAKPSGSLWIPVLGLAWLIGRWRRSGKGQPVWWRDVLGAGLGLAVTYGLWFGYSVAFGYPGPAFWQQPSAGPRGVRAFVKGLRANHFDVLKVNWDNQFWGYFAWLNIALPGWVYTIFLYVTLAFVAVIVVETILCTLDGWRLWRARRRNQPGDAEVPGTEAAANTIVCLLGVIATVGGLIVVMFEYFQSQGRFDLMQGRYGLMMMPALLALPVLLLNRLLPKLSPVIPMAVIAVALCLLNVLGLATIVDAFYL